MSSLVRFSPKRGRARLAVVLTVVVTQIGVSAPSHAADAPPRSPAAPRTLPPLVSSRPPSETSEAKPSTEFVPLPGLPAASGPIGSQGAGLQGATTTPPGASPVERTETADIFENPDGSRTAVVRARRINWKDPQGRWEKLDSQLVPGPDDTYRPRSGPLAVSFPGTLAADRLISIGKEGWSIGFGLEGAASARAVVTGNTNPLSQRRQGRRSRIRGRLRTGQGGDRPGAGPRRTPAVPFPAPTGRDHSPSRVGRERLLPGPLRTRGSNDPGGRHDRGGWQARE